MKEEQKMTKTYAELIAETPNLFNGTDMEDDTATQSLIYDWFQYRRVASNTKFPTYIKRIVNRDYTRYLQLLRIEAGKVGDTNSPTRYDWLVTDYLESLDHEKGIDSNSETTGGTSATKRGINKTTIESLDSNANSESQSSSSSEQSAHTETNSDVQSDTTGSANTGTTATAKAGSMSRTTPMTQQYSQAQMNAGDTRRAFVVKTTSGEEVDYTVGEAADQSEIPSGEVKGNIRSLYRNFPELNIQNPTGVSDSRTTNASVSDTSNKGHDHTWGDADDNYTDSNSSGSDSNESTTSSNASSNRVVDEVYGDGEDTVTATGTKSGNGSHNIDKTHQHTGRNGETADILTRVIKFIDKSSAFDWYRKQLEPCFIGVFEEEDYE